MLYEILRKTAKGTADIYQKNGRVYLSRFTKEQRELYFTQPDFFMKTHATSGIRLEFSTNADKLEMSGVIESGSSRSFYSFDIYVGGVLDSHIFSEYDKGKKTQFSFATTLPEGENDVVIYFPQLACASVEKLLLDGAEPSENINYRVRENNLPKAIFYGDSITQGYDAYHPSFSYPAILSRRFDMDFLNKGIGGDAHNFKVLAKDYFTPDVIFVAYGTNDWNKRLTRKGFVDNIEEYHHKLRELYPDTPIIVFSPVWRKDMGDFKPAGDFAKIYSTMCDICTSDENITVLDGIGFVAHSEEMFSDKKLHPNELGFFVYADSICRAISNNKESNVCRMLTERMHF